MSSKKDKRLESKKRKAVAFLNLVKAEKQEDTMIDNVKTTEEPDIKKIKTEDKPTTEKCDNHALESAETTVKKEHNDNSETTFDWKDAKPETIMAAFKKESRKKSAMQRPKIYLSLDELTRDNPIENEFDEVKKVPPLFVTEVQHLLLYGLLSNKASVMPRWCRLLRPGKVTKVVILVLESVNKEDYTSNTDSLPTLHSAFDVQAELIPPIQYGSTVREDILNVPLKVSQLKQQESFSKRRMESIKNLDDCKTTNNLLKNPLDLFKQITSIKHPKTRRTDAKGLFNAPSTSLQDKIDRTQLMLNTAQLIIENIPIPLGPKSQTGYYVFTKDTYSSITKESPMFAVDCEMVQTKRSQMDLARVSIVNENLECVYDTFVKPWSPVINYVTRYSGITKAILDPVTTRIQDVQRHIRDTLPDNAILCGQSIGGDLRSMQMFHPYIVDTSVIYNLSNNRGRKTGLRRLADHFLGRSIQDSKEGHSSIEDAEATMELVLLKLRNGLEFGDLLMTNVCVMEEVKAQDTNTNTTDEAAETNTDTSDTTVTAEQTAMDTDCADVVKDSTEMSDLIEDSFELADKAGYSDKTFAQAGESAETSDKKEAKSKSLDISDSNTANIVKNDLLYPELDKSNSESDKTTAVVSNNKTDLNEIAKRRLFFQREGNRFIENFTHSINKMEKKGTIIDIPSSRRLYPDTVPIMLCNTDKEAEQQTTLTLQEKDFCYTEMYGYKQYLQQCKCTGETDLDKLKKSLWKLDRRVWKVMKHLPEKSLCVVILTGREHNQQLSPAMMFAKIT